MSRFYGFPSFRPGRSAAFVRYWMEEGMRLIRLRERLEKGVDDDDQMYEMMKEYAGEEAAGKALFERRAARMEAKRKRDAERTAVA